jgi:hypothetical protein
MVGIDLTTDMKHALLTENYGVQKSLVLYPMKHLRIEFLMNHLICTMDGLYAFRCKRFPNTRYKVTFGIPVSRDTHRGGFSWTSNKALSKLFHCSVRNTWATGWLDVVHRTSGLYKILVLRVNCRPTVTFLAILSAKLPLNLCSRLRFFESNIQEHALHL